MKDYDSSDAVFYLDPPYLNSASVYDCEFGETDHIMLCEQIFKTKGFVGLSGYKNEIYDRYDWDDIAHWDVPIRAKGVTHATGCEKRGRADEYLFIKEARL
jgi:site-specific DNA-adenine methylase